MITIKASDIKLSPATQLFLNETNYPNLDRNIKDMFLHLKSVLESDPPESPELRSAWTELLNQFLDKMVVYQRSDDIGKPADIWHSSVWPAKKAE